MAKSAAPGAYQRDDDHDQHAVRPCHRRAVGVARVKSSRRLPVGPATAPRTSDVEVDHIKDVPHVLRFAYFLLAPAGARNLQKLASSWRASPAVPDRNFSVSARQKIDEARRSGQWCQRAWSRCGRGRAGLASSSEGRRKRRGGRGGHSCGSARGDDGRVGALCAPRPV